MLKEALKYAAKGSFDRANVLAPILGALVIGVVARALSVPLAAPSGVLDTSAFVTACVVISWIATVIVRVLYWPWMKLKKIQLSSPSSPLEVFVDPQNSCFWEFAENPHQTPFDEDRHGQFCHVEVVNHGSRTIDGVSVVYWYEGETNHHLAYGTAKTKLSLDPNGRKLVKLFFQASQDYTGEGEFVDPQTKTISVRAIARNTLSSPDLHLEYKYNDRGRYDEGPFYEVSVRKLT